MPPITARRVLVFFCMLSFNCAMAQENSLEQQNTWRTQVTPYVWMTGLQGYIRPTASLPTAHVSQSFSDVLGNLDAAAFINATARRGRWVVHVDLTYAAVSDHAALPMGLQGQAKVTQRSLTVLGGKNWELSTADSVDLMAGIRWWNVSADVNVQPLLQAGIQESFADPIGAIRWRRQWDPRWSTLVYADAGGLGVGSKLTSQLMAVANYELKNGIVLTGGYRHMNVDYREGGTRLNVGMTGPVVGLTFRF